MSSPIFFPVLLSAALILLTTSISASTPPTSPTSLETLAAIYERAAIKSYSKGSTERGVKTLEGLLSKYIKMDKQSGSEVRMLLTVQEQVNIYRFLGKELGDDKVAGLEGEPDVCERISTFVGFVFDNAAELLRHGAGWEKECMRGFQQVLHIREVIRLVLIKMGKPADGEGEEEVCVDKVLIAVYGWLKGALIAVARQEGMFRAVIHGETEEMVENLKEKRRMVVKLRIDQVLDVEEVRPVPGEDFPAIEGVDGCFEVEEGAEDGDDDDDNDGDDDDDDGEFDVEKDLSDRKVKSTTA